VPTLLDHPTVDSTLQRYHRVNATRSEPTETFGRLLRRLAADPLFGPALEADQLLALRCYELAVARRERA
jgi:hypothetical protein